jgi:hypothetical protein
MRMPEGREGPKQGDAGNLGERKGRLRGEGKEGPGQDSSILDH